MNSSISSFFYGLRFYPICITLPPTETKLEPAHQSPYPKEVTVPVTTFFVPLALIINYKKPNLLIIVGFSILGSSSKLFIYLVCLYKLIK